MRGVASATSTGGDKPQPVIALDFIARVGYILQGFGVIDPVEPGEDLWRDGLAR